MITSPVSVPRVLAREHVPLMPAAPATTLVAPVVSVAPTWPGVRVTRPWTQAIATIDLVLTRAHRLTGQALATGQQWEVKGVLATVLGARSDTPSVVLEMRYAHLLGTMTYAERFQLLTAVRVCSRVPEEFRLYMERARGCRDSGGNWRAMEIAEFQAIILGPQITSRLLAHYYQKLKDRLLGVWKMELQAAHRGCTGRDLEINPAEAALLLGEHRVSPTRLLPDTVKQRLLGMTPVVRATYTTQEFHRNFERTLRRCDRGLQRRVGEVLEHCTAFALTLDVAALQTLASEGPPGGRFSDKTQLYRRILGLEDLGLANARKRIAVMLRNATAHTVAAYCETHRIWVGARPDDYCRRARHAMAEVERTGQRITHDAFKRLVLDASDAMPHEGVLDRYTAFRTEVFTAEEKSSLDAAHLVCTGYRDGRRGKAQHEEFVRIVAARSAFAEALAAAVQSGMAGPMEAGAYEAALMAQGQPTRARTRTAYKGFLTYLDPVMRRQFGAWHAIICRPTTAPVAESLQRAMTCALEVQERIARGGAYLSVGDFQLRVMKGSEVLDLRVPYYRLRDTLDAAQQALLDAYMLAATGRPPHHRGRHPPPHAQVPIAGLVQRGLEYARALRHADTTVTPTEFYQHLFGNTVPGAELRRLAALVQRQAPRADQILLDVALGLATHTLWLNGGTVPIAYLQHRGDNGTRQWRIARGATDHTVTSVTPSHLDAVMGKIRELSV